MPRVVGYGPLGHAEDTANITAAEVAAQLTGLPGGGNFAVQVAGTFTATITFEATVNGTNWASVELLPSTDLTDTALTATASAAGLFVGKMPMGVSGFRARVSAFTNNTSGTLMVRWARE